MKYPMFLHWSEGQFLQPHHFQQFQRIINDAIAERSNLTMPFIDGICELEVDTDALRSRRIVISSFMAVMPDGTILSMPSNCAVDPYTVELNQDDPNDEIVVYLAIPYYSRLESNLCDSKEDSNRRYLLHEAQVVDENTGDNETTIFKRSINVRLITDPKKASDCAVLPILKLHWVNSNITSGLEIDNNYIPPTLIVSGNCRLFTMVRELLFELRNCKTKLLRDLETSGFVPTMATGATVLKILLLQSINVYISSISNILIPDKVTPFALYCELTKLLASLKALYPLSDLQDPMAYDHYNLYPVFDDVIQSIRGLLNTNGKAEFIAIDFKLDEQNKRLCAVFDDSQISKSSEFFIFLEGGLDWKGLIDHIESGDNFRLIDAQSIDSRVRGVKLSYARFPPRCLPLHGSNNAYFKIMQEESTRMWHYIVEDHRMFIDYAPSLFNGFNAKLYILVEK